MESVQYVQVMRKSLHTWNSLSVTDMTSTRKLTNMAVSRTIEQRCLPCYIQTKREFIQINVLVLSWEETICLTSDQNASNNRIVNSARKEHYFLIAYRSWPSLIISGSQRGPRDAHPLGVQILSFLCSFLQQICKIIPIWSWRNPFGKILDPPLLMPVQ